MDGNFPYEGRVEIFYQGQWGTICDDSWENQDANVVCRQLGFTESSEFLDGRFLMGTGAIILDNVECLGNESSLLACPHNGFGVHDCSHTEDVGVRCNVVTTASPNKPTGEYIQCYILGLTLRPPPPKTKTMSFNLAFMFFFKFVNLPRVGL